MSDAEPSAKTARESTQDWLFSMQRFLSLHYLHPEIVLIDVL